MEPQLRESLTHAGCELWEYRIEWAIAHLEESQTPISPALAAHVHSYSLLAFDLTQDEFHILQEWLQSWNLAYPEFRLGLRVENYSSDACLVFGAYDDEVPWCSPPGSSDDDEMSLDNTEINDWALPLLPPDQREPPLDPIGVLFRV